MRILLASSELFPYSKSGGLADMVASLGKSLAHLGHQVGIVTPFYKWIRDQFHDLHPVDWSFDFEMGPNLEHGWMYCRQAETNLTIYFIDHAHYYQRNHLYLENGHVYPDNADRFLFFSRCVGNLARYLPWKPEVIHVHDWQTGIVPAILHHQAAVDGWSDPPRTCFTIHNLAYQGAFPPDAMSLAGLPMSYFSPAGIEFYGQLNCLKAGICYADHITTVSPRYAWEITTPEFGCGLDGVLRIRLDRLTGILNGVDYDEWKTLNNPHLKFSFTSRNLGLKTAGKKALQKELGLPVDAQIPMFASVTRLAEQKGVDIQLEALREMLVQPIQFVLLGTGEPRYETAYQELAAEFPEKVSANLTYNHGLAHRIEAGSDFFLMPSRFEPCGLNQMYSLRYGTIPIVRVTGGLDDSVVDIAEDFKHANGIKFHAYSADALVHAMHKALDLFGEKDLLRRYRRLAMHADFSLERTARSYLEVYEEIMRPRTTVPPNL